MFSSYVESPSIASKDTSVDVGNLQALSLQVLQQPSSMNQKGLNSCYIPYVNLWYKKNTMEF